MNPLKNLMGKNNPLMSMMGGNNPLSMLGGGNPQQMMMNMLKQQNPQAFQQVEQMMNSGMKPQEAMKQMGVTPEQLEQVKQQAKGMFGDNIKF